MRVYVTAVMASLPSTLGQQVASMSRLRLSSLLIFMASMTLDLSVFLSQGPSPLWATLFLGT